MFSLRKIQSKLDDDKSKRSKKAARSSSIPSKNPKNISKNNAFVTLDVPKDSKLPSAEDLNDGNNIDHDPFNKDRKQRYFSNLKIFSENETPYSENNPSDVSIEFTRSKNNSEIELDKSVRDSRRKGRSMKKKIMKKEKLNSVKESVSICDIVDQTVEPLSTNESKPRDISIKSTRSDIAQPQSLHISKLSNHSGNKVNKLGLENMQGERDQKRNNKRKPSQSVQNKEKLHFHQSAKSLKKKKKTCEITQYEDSAGFNHDTGICNSIQDHDPVIKSIKNQGHDQDKLQSRDHENQDHDHVIKYSNRDSFKRGDRKENERGKREKREVSNNEQCSLLSENMANQFINIHEINGHTVMIALLPESRLFLTGFYWLKSVSGSIEVLGYKFSKDEKRAIFSSANHFTVSIDAIEGENINVSSMKKLGVPAEWTKQVTSVTKTPVIVEIKRYTSTLTSFLNETAIIPTVRSHKKNVFEGVNVLNSYITPFDVDPDWDNFINTLDYNAEKAPRIVIAGGKALGKSTFLKYLANKIINNKKEVAILNLDPGQPEFGLPGTLSLTGIATPLLGPSFSHFEDTKLTYQSNVAYGDVGVQGMSQEYFEIVNRLTKEFEASTMSIHNKTPLIVNTMGYVQNVGLDIMVDIIKLVKPTHVVTIESSERKYNFEHRISPDFVCFSNRGMVTRSMNIELEYETCYMSVAGGLSKYEGGRSQRASGRDLLVLSYLSRLWKDTEDIVASPLSCKKATVIRYEDIGIHIADTSVPSSHIMMALNGALVALCQVKNLLQSMGPGLPKKLIRTNEWMTSNSCVGWGVVRGIDPLKREIHLLTPLSEQDMADVNVIFLPKNQLPDIFTQLFSVGRDRPYMTKKKPPKVVGRSDISQNWRS